MLVSFNLVNSHNKSQSQKMRQNTAFGGINQDWIKAAKRNSCEAYNGIIGIDYAFRNRYPHIIQDLKDTLPKILADSEIKMGKALREAYQEMLDIVTAQK